MVNGRFIDEIQGGDDLPLERGYEEKPGRGDDVG